jgi:hypothetical protein
MNCVKAVTEIVAPSRVYRARAIINPHVDQCVFGNYALSKTLSQVHVDDRS